MGEADGKETCEKFVYFRGAARGGGLDFQIAV
jgi:hypothetical protein